MTAETKRGPRPHSVINSHASIRKRSAHYDEEARRAYAEKIAAAGAKTRQDEASRGEPPCALAPPNLAPADAILWLAGYGRALAIEEGRP